MTGDAMTSPIDVDLLQQAATWRAMALLFEAPEAHRLAELARLRENLEDADLQLAIAGESEVTGSQYVDAFGPGGLVSPREVAYRGREDPGRILADISAFHEAFAFRARAQDPQDHVGRECDFVGYLFLKEAFALSQGNDDAAAICREGRDSFVREHLRSFAAPMGLRLRDIQHPVLAAVGRALHARVGDPEAPPTLEADASEPPDDLTCGGCTLTGPPLTP